MRSLLSVAFTLLALTILVNAFCVHSNAASNILTKRSPKTGGSRGVAYHSWSSHHHHTTKPVKLTNTTVTWYGFDDNCCVPEGAPPGTNATFGGACISFAGQAPPRFHTQATETKGTYDDPTTFAADPTAFPVGTIIYYPAVKKYFVMEDECAECIIDFANGIIHVDLWVGPSTFTNGTVMCCEDALTSDQPMTIIKNPPPDLPVNKKSLFTCDCIVTGLIGTPDCALVNNGGIC
ncbi:hypothetical protein HDV00_002093 [Rhizophlyctis rosea]|nr:hypothetical protein HDV00_002093 [Rhizophlyctis rosea]